MQRFNVDVELVALCGLLMLMLDNSKTCDKGMLQVEECLPAKKVVGNYVEGRKKKKIEGRQQVYI